MIFLSFFMLMVNVWNFTSNFKIILLMSQAREPYEIAVICQLFSFNVSDQEQGNDTAGEPQASKDLR